MGYNFIYLLCVLVLIMLALRLFLPIPADVVPQDSILREFIGGSCFHE